jgi:hypothetical protein
VVIFHCDGNGAAKTKMQTPFETANHPAPWPPPPQDNAAPPPEQPAPTTHQDEFEFFQFLVLLAEIVDAFLLVVDGDVALCHFLLEPAPRCVQCARAHVDDMSDQQDDENGGGGRGGGEGGGDEKEGEEGNCVCLSLYGWVCMCMRVSVCV